jgi:hypothetical protein
MKPLSLQACRDPHLDQRLLGYTELLGLTVEPGDNPAGQVHVDPFGRDIGAARLGPIDPGGDVFP